MLTPEKLAPSGWVCYRFIYRDGHAVLRSFPTHEAMQEEAEKLQHLLLKLEDI